MSWREYVMLTLSKLTAGFLDTVRGHGEKLHAQKHMAGGPSLTADECVACYFWPNKADIAADVRRIFSRHISLDVSHVHPDDKPVDDLRMDALDSMSAIEFVMELERFFDIDIPNKAAAEMRTLNDLTQFITRELRQN